MDGSVGPTGAVHGARSADTLIPPKTLVLGGARSGKTAFAERLVVASGGGVYVATGQAHDGEMAARIARHRADRSERLTTIEAPLDLVDALVGHAPARRPLLVDCLTLWVTNLMMAERDVDAAADRLVACLADLPAPVVFVSNEVGLGIVPDNAMARAFRDHAGRLNQRLAAACDHVLFIAAGLPLVLKPAPALPPLLSKGR